MATQIVSRPLVPIHQLTRHLYGTKVPAIHYAILKAITDALVGQTTHREYLVDARRRCARLALAAWKRAGAA
jgi:hypothetical protein